VTRTSDFTFQDGAGKKITGAKRILEGFTGSGRTNPPMNIGVTDSGEDLEIVVDQIQAGIPYRFGGYVNYAVEPVR
jgi:hypothetical protein